MSEKEKYKASKKMAALMEKGHILRATADALVVQSIKMLKQAIEQERKGWNLFWEDNPDADKDVVYTYMIVSQSIKKTDKE